MYDAIIVSDFHLGSDVCQAKRIQKFLEEIHDGKLETKELILNGDVFDSWDFRRLKKNHWNVLSEIRKLSDKIRVIWVNGNHDGPSDIVSHLIGVDVAEEYELVSGDKKIIIMHGHQFDKFISEHPFITSIADWFYRLMQKIDKSFRWMQRAKRASKTFLRCSEIIETKAKNYAIKKGYDIVCCGHVHLECAHPITNENDIGYFNSGCWTEYPGFYLAIKNGEVKVKRFEYE